MTALDLDEIERLALAAAPGPWRVDVSETESLYRSVSVEAENVMVTVMPGFARPDGSGQALTDAAHIASMSPSTTLAVVAEVRRLRDERDYLLGLACCSREGHDARGRVAEIQEYLREDGAALEAAEAELRRLRAVAEAARSLASAVRLSYCCLRHCDHSGPNLDCDRCREKIPGTNAWTQLLALDAALAAPEDGP